jgi:hypothetical protein
VAGARGARRLTAHNVCPRRARLVGGLALREDGDAHGLAGAVGQDGGAAHHLVASAGIDLF